MTKRLSPEDRKAFEVARAERMRQLASVGGLACKHKYGREYYRKIGRLGFDAAKEKLELTDAQMVLFLKHITNPDRKVAQPGDFHPLQVAKRNAMGGTR